MSQFVTADWLKQHLNDRNIKIVDCRFDLQDPSKGRKEYLEAHLPNAFYLNLEKDLSSPVKKHGGRHPLPNEKAFAFKMGELGIDHKTHVIAYDNQNGSMAARLWWLLRYFGHMKVSVLTINFDAWKKQGYPITQDKSLCRPTQFVAHPNHKMVVKAEEILSGLNQPQPQTILIDSREESRYKGIHEPIDKKAGHIPGAANWFWKDNLDKHGEWLSETDLKKRFDPLTDKERLTVYCGSGVTACANVLAMTEAGHENIQLYPGSWSDWISFPNHPVEKD